MRLRSRDGLVELGGLPSHWGSCAVCRPWRAMTSLLEYDLRLCVLGMGCSGGAHWIPDLGRERNVLQVVAMRRSSGQVGVAEGMRRQRAVHTRSVAVEGMPWCLELSAARARRSNEWRQHRNGAVSHCDAHVHCLASYTSGQDPAWG